MAASTRCGPEYYASIMADFQFALQALAMRAIRPHQSPACGRCIDGPEASISDHIDGRQRHLIADARRVGEMPSRVELGKQIVRRHPVHRNDDLESTQGG